MMILGANIRALGSHLAGWRHPTSWPKSVMQLQNSIQMAQMVEAAKLHFVFLADGNGVRQMKSKSLFAASAPSDRPAVFVQTHVERFYFFWVVGYYHRLFEDFFR